VTAAIVRSDERRKIPSRNDLDWMLSRTHRRFQLLAVISPSFDFKSSAERTRPWLGFGSEAFLALREPLYQAERLSTWSPCSVLAFPPCAKYFSSPLLTLTCSPF
jgi:hypothetical protein